MIIKWFGHASFEIKTANKVIYIDPYKGESADYKDLADIILVSRWHFSNCRLEIVRKIRQENTVVLTTRETVSEIGGIIGQPNIAWNFQDNVRIIPVDSYTIDRPEAHPKGTGLGFIIESEGKRLYYAGDSSFTPEMAKVKADIVILPVGGTFVMDAREAARAAETIGPKLAIPSHYGSLFGSRDDANWFKELLEAKNIQVIILEIGKDYEF